MHRTDWHNRKAIGLYSGGTQFESWPEHRVPWQRYIVVFSVPQIQYLHSILNRPLPFSFKSIPINHSWIILSFDAIQPRYQHAGKNTKKKTLGVRISHSEWATLMMMMMIVMIMMKCRRMMLIVVITAVLSNILPHATWDNKWINVFN
jgi:hypothetical protein